MLRLNTSSSAPDRSVLKGGPFWSASASYPKTLTYLVRVAPVAGVTYGSQTRLLDVWLQLPAVPFSSDGGALISFSVCNDSLAKGIYIERFEQSSLMSKVSTALDMTVPHIFQLSVRMDGPHSGSFTIYADGSDTPIVPTVTSTDMIRTWEQQEFITFGDEGAYSVVSDIDWMAWTTAGAFKPSQLKGALPGGLGITTGY
ncbi:MAG: hypothetical protein QM803_06715 [Rhodocyclaceae bacterium]